MDILLGRFAEAEAPGMSEPELACFECLLAAEDPVLHGWLMAPATAEAAFGDLITRLRAFHGLANG